MVKASLKVQTVNCRPCQFDIDVNGEVTAFTGIVNVDKIIDLCFNWYTVSIMHEYICNRTRDTQTNYNCRVSDLLLNN